MYSMVEYVHKRMTDYPKRRIGADFTMGQGNDTLFLADLCQEVYSFDVQPAAIMATKKKIGERDNVHLILDSHEYLDDHLDSFDIGVFNLGYLPGADHTIKTQLASTKVALKKAVAIMDQVLFVVCYVGHSEGLIEAQWIDQYVEKLDSHLYNVSTYRMMNKKGSPYVIEIEKRQ